MSTASSRVGAVHIALFNHKGGVGKTTLTVNIAHALAELGHRVLLVDADPQCNLTSYLLPPEAVDKELDSARGETGNTLYSAVWPVTDSNAEPN